MYCIEHRPGLWDDIRAFLSLWPMFQRLEDRIKELCHEAAATPQSPELEQILHNLKAALAEHTRRMRKLAAGFPVMVRGGHGLVSARRRGYSADCPGPHGRLYFCHESQASGETHS